MSVADCGVCAQRLCRRPEALGHLSEIDDRTLAVVEQDLLVARIRYIKVSVRVQRQSGRTANSREIERKWGRIGSRPGRGFPHLIRPQIGYIDVSASVYRDPVRRLERASPNVRELRSRHRHQVATAGWQHNDLRSC